MSNSYQDNQPSPSTIGRRINVDRNSYDQHQFDAEFGKIEPAKQTLSNWCKTKCTCSPKTTLKSLLGIVPIVETLRSYAWKKNILMDMIAGLSVGMVHIPQGMGFALLAAVAPVYGLYASFWQILLYMIFGNCRHLSIGTMAVISLIVGAVVEREVVIWKANQGGVIQNTTSATTTPLFSSGPTLASFDFNVSTDAFAEPVEGLTEEDRFRSSVACGVSLIAGITMLCMGIFQMGAITTFMPTSFIGGFTTAAGFHITTTQLKFLLNVPVVRYGGIFNLPRSIFAIIMAVPLTNIPDLVVTIITFSFLVFIKEFVNVKYKKRLKIPVPADMIVVIAATIISFAAGFNERWGVRIVGFIPPGIPGPQMPNLDRASTYVIDGMIAGVTSFAISISMVDILTKKHKYSYNPNNELVAYGLTYGLSSFFHCFVGAGAPPRCYIMELTGGKTQVASFFSASLLLLVLLAIAPVFRYLPNASLACIIIVALFPLFKQFKELPRIWKLSKPDFVVWIITFIVSIVFDVSISLGVGIVVAAIASVVPSLWAKGYIYTQMDHSDLYGPMNLYEKGKSAKGVVVFRFDSTLYYLTVKRFVRELTNATFDPLCPPTSTDPRTGKNDTGPDGTQMSELVVNGPDKIEGTLYPLLSSGDPNEIKVIVLDCSCMSYIDYMGINTLKRVIRDYSAVKVDVVLASCHTAFLEKLQNAEIIGEGHDQMCKVYPTIQDAVSLLSSHIPDQK